MDMSRVNLTSSAYIVAYVSDVHQAYLPVSQLDHRELESNYFVYSGSYAIL